MSGVATTLLYLALVNAAAGPRELVAALGSPRYAEREAAAASLAKLGRSALAALRESRQSADPEIRSRVAGLLEKIEGSLLLEPTPVTLDFRDRPLVDVIGEINRRSGLNLTLGPVRNAALESRRVTLLSPEPIPFWSAVDRLCEASGLQYGFMAHVGLNGRDATFPLAQGDARPGGLMSDHGPFRVNLMSLHYQRDLTFVAPSVPPQQFAPPGGGPIAGLSASSQGRLTQEQFYIRLQAAAEPTLTVSQAGAIKLTAAVDDLGQSLVVPPSGPQMMHVSGYYGMTPGPVQFQLFLKRPDRPGRTIKVLRGTLPLLVSTRKPEPLVVPLSGSVGKTFRNEDVSLAIVELKPNPNTNQHSIDVSVTPRTSRGPVGPGDPDFMAYRNDIGPLQIELADASGKTLPWFLSGSTQNGDDTRLTLTVLPGPSGQAAPPGSLRYFGTIRTNAEVPFEFRDVPMP